MRTSEKNWLDRAAKFYTSKQPFTLSDAGELGIREDDLTSAATLMRAAKSRGYATVREIIGALTGIGITGVGVWMITAAITGPEPT